MIEGFLAMIIDYSYGEVFLPFFTDPAHSEGKINKQAFCAAQHWMDALPKWQRREVKKREVQVHIKSQVIHF